MYLQRQKSYTTRSDHENVVTLKLRLISTLMSEKQKINSLVWGPLLAGRGRAPKCPLKSDHESRTIAVTAKLVRRLRAGSCCCCCCWLCTRICTRTIRRHRTGGAVSVIVIRCGSRTDERNGARTNVTASRWICRRHSILGVNIWLWRRRQVPDPRCAPTPAVADSNPCGPRPSWCSNPCGRRLQSLRSQTLVVLQPLRSQTPTPAVQTLVVLQPPQSQTPTLWSQTLVVLRFLQSQTPTPAVPDPRDAPTPAVPDPRGAPTPAVPGHAGAATPAVPDSNPCGPRPSWCSNPCGARPSWWSNHSVPQPNTIAVASSFCGPAAPRDMNIAARPTPINYRPHASSLTPSNPNYYYTLPSSLATPASSGILMDSAVALSTPHSCPYSGCD